MIFPFTLRVRTIIFFQGLHRGEQNDLPDGVAVGKQHDTAVDADAQTARGRHTVLQGGKEVLVHHAGFVISLIPQLHLLLEAAPLVDGVVELGEGVAHLTVADEQLEPLGEPGVLGGPLGQWGHIHRMHGDEGGLDQPLLHLLIKALIQGVAPGLVRGLGQLHADGLGGSHRLLVTVDGHEVDAAVLLHRLMHRHAGPSGSQVDLLPLPLHLVGAQDLLGGGGEQVLEQIHHVVEIGVGLVELHGGELRIVLRVHALIAENATDLIHPVQTAHNETL